MEQRRIKVTYTITKEITSCWNVCPYYDTDMNTMVCTHPEAENSGYIISHPQCRHGFPTKCPLLKT